MNTYQYVEIVEGISIILATSGIGLLAIALTLKVIGVI
jgi:hypothetical protein